MPQETSSGPLKPADLAKLELSFASDPQSRAFIELANAYIDLNRMVEAMVVAKKGMKVHPVDGHFILAKIYHKQQKNAKAVEELNQVIASDPANVQAHVLKGNIHFRLGEDAAGIEVFKKAFELAPDSVEVKATLMEHGVDIAPKSEPPPPPDDDDEVTGDGLAMEEGEPAPEPRRPMRAPKSGVRQAIRPKKPVTRPRPATVPGDASVTAGYDAAHHDDERPVRPAPARRPRSTAPATPAVHEDFSGTPDWMSKQAARRTMILIGILATLSITIIVGIAIYAARVRKIDRLSKDISASIKLDTYAGYRKARELSVEVIKVDSGNGFQYSTGAYIDAILFGEFGEPETVAKEASDYLEQAIKVKDVTPMVNTAQAILRLYRGDAKGAEQAAMEGLQKNNQYPKLLLVMGLIQTAAGNYDGALESYKRGRNSETQNDPKSSDPRSLMLMGDLSSRQGYGKQALAQYEFALKGQPDHVGALLGRAAVFGDMDEKRRAAEADVQKVFALPQGVASKKELAKANFIMSMILRADGREADATRSLNAALDLDPQNAQFHFMLARRYVVTREFDKAKASFKRAIDLDAKKPEFYREFAEMQTATGDYEGAIQNVTRAMMHLADRDKGPYYLVRARALRMKKDFKEAQKEISKVLALNSEDPFAHLEMARLYQDQGNVDMAGAEYENAITGFQAIQNPRKGAEAMVQLARMQMEGKATEQTEELLKKAVERDKNYADAYYWLGRLFNGDKATRDDARQLFQQYLKLAPNGEFAGQAKKEL